MNAGASFAAIATLVAALSCSSNVWAGESHFVVRAYSADDFIGELSTDDGNIGVNGFEDELDFTLTVEGLGDQAFVVQRSSRSYKDFMVKPTEGTTLVAVDGTEWTSTLHLSHGDIFYVGEFMFEVSKTNTSEPKAYDPDNEYGDATDVEPYVPPKVIEPIDVHATVAAGLEERVSEFSDRAYTFCHDESFGENGVVGADLCAIMDDTTLDACPLAQAKCADWLAAEEAWVKSGRDPRVAEAKRLRKKQMPSFNLNLPPWLAWGGLILGLAVLLFFVGRSILDAGWETDEFELPDDEVLSDAARNLQALPEARAVVLIRLAQKALNGGDPGEAAILLHLACLRHFDDSGVAQYHPSKTNGDYLRALRRDKPLRNLFKQVAFHTERLRFGDGHVDSDDVTKLIEEAKTKLNRTTNRPGAAGPSLATSLVLCAVALTQSGCPQDSPWHPYYSHEPAGMAALPALLEEAGLDVTISRQKWIDVPSDTSVVVLRTSAAGPSYWPSEIDLDALLDRGLSVVMIDDLNRSQRVFPVTGTTANYRPPKVVNLDLKVEGHYCTSDILLSYTSSPQVLLPAARRLAWTGNEPANPVSRHSLVAAPFLDYRELPVDIKGETAAAAFAIQRQNDSEPLAGCLYLFADRDLFTNASLSRPDNLAFVTAFFADLAGTGKVMLMERLDRWAIDADGSKDDKKNKGPGRALKASNMLPFLAQGFVTLALLLVFLGAAFGPLRDPIQRTHKNFVEHVEALGRQYARTGKPGLTHSATSLANLVILRYRDKVRGGIGGGWGGLAEDLADKKNIPLPHVKAALRLGLEGQHDLGPPSDAEPEPASEDMLRTLNRLLRSSKKKGSAT